jgi:hypothetical protein
VGDERITRNKAGLAADELGEHADLMITVCDRAHEELDPDRARLHWSIADPVTDGSRRAFDRALAELRGRIVGLVGVGS